MKEILARIVYWFVGLVLWTIRGWDAIEIEQDDGNILNVKWWVFSESSCEQHQSCTRAMGNISTWLWDGEYKLCRWAGRRFHFAYRHSFGSGKGVRAFFKCYGVAYRLGL